jgi:hypothetical protein
MDKIKMVSKNQYDTNSADTQKLVDLLLGMEDYFGDNEGTMSQLMEVEINGNFTMIGVKVQNEPDKLYRKKYEARIMLYYEGISFMEICLNGEDQVGYRGTYVHYLMTMIAPPKDIVKGMIKKLEDRHAII